MTDLDNSVYYCSVSSIPSPSFHLIPHFSVVIARVKPTHFQLGDVLPPESMVEIRLGAKLRLGKSEGIE